jgi:replicative DNA helicase
MSNMSGNKDSLTDKLPPQNIDAEESLISAILLDNDILLEILDILSPKDFYRNAHQKIFEAITALANKGEPVDLVTLADYLKGKNQLDDIGGATYLARLMDTAPVPSNARNYAAIVRDKAALRRMISAASSITNRCLEYGTDVEEVIDFAERTIFEIAENKLKPAYYAIGKIIEANVDALVERRGNKNLISGIPTGFTKLDSLTSGFQKSDLIILAARPSMGKTALALNFARNAAVEAGVPVLFFSLEMSKEQLAMRLLCAEARIDSARIRDGFFNDEDWERITDAADVLQHAPIYLDDTAGISSMEIKTKTRRLKMEKDIGLIIIDYLQLMQTRSRLERRDLEISDMSRSLKGLAKELNIPVIALSQLNRKLEDRSDKHPQLSDLRESGALEQDADLVIFIYRDEVYNADENNPKKGIAEVYLAKQRNGPLGMEHMRFMDTYTRFENLAYGYEGYLPEGNPDA